MQCCCTPCPSSVSSPTAHPPPRPPTTESRRRFSPGKDANDELAAAEGGKPATAGGLRSHSPSAACLAPGEEEEEESQSQRLGRTVEQLRELVQQGGELGVALRARGASWAGLRALGGTGWLHTLACCGALPAPPRSREAAAHSPLSPSPSPSPPSPFLSRPRV